MQCSDYNKVPAALNCRNEDIVLLCFLFARMHGMLLSLLVGSSLPSDELSNRLLMVISTGYQYRCVWEGKTLSILIWIPSTTIIKFKGICLLYTWSMDGYGISLHTFTCTHWGWGHANCYFSVQYRFLARGNRLSEAIVPVWLSVNGGYCSELAQCPAESLHLCFLAFISLFSDPLCT